MGSRVGKEVGASVGSCVGSAVGSRVGRAVGSDDGSAVGARLGNSDGWFIDIFVGERREGLARGGHALGKVMTDSRHNCGKEYRQWVGKRRLGGGGNA